MDPVASDLQPASKQNSAAVWGPVATLLWTVVIAIAFLLAQTLTVFIYVFVTMRHLSRGEAEAALKDLAFDGAFLFFCTFAGLVVCVPLIAGLAKLKHGSRVTDYLALNVPRLGQLMRWSLVTIVFCGLLGVISSLLRIPTPEFMLKVSASAAPPWLLWLALSIDAPVFEEICFRGFIFKGLAESRLRWYGATLVTSVLWAAIHVQYDWYGIASIFALGLLFGTARAMTHSTLLTIWLHCFFNTLATVGTAIELRQSSIGLSG